MRLVPVKSTKKFCVFFNFFFKRLRESDGSAMHRAIAQTHVGVAGFFVVFRLFMVYCPNLATHQVHWVVSYSH